MGLTLRPDPHHPAGGYALLTGHDVASVTALSVENVFSSQFLGPDGKWGKLRHAFAVAPAKEPDALRLGPEIVDHILTDLLIALRDGGGTLLGRLVWPDSIVPRRDANQGRVSDGWVNDATLGAEAAPPAEPVTVRPPQPDPVDVRPGPVTTTGDDDASPVPRRRRWLPPLFLALVAVVGLAAWSLRPHPREDHVAETTPPPSVDHAQLCAKSFDTRVAAAQDAPDSDRVKLAEEAIGASCGAQAFQAVDGTRWETNEPAAWYQARFYDPDETAPVFRDGHPPDPRAAFDYYARWADRSPRQADALRKLCATHPEVVGDNAQRRRACAR